MFEQYDNKQYSQYDSWKTKVRLISEHRGIEEIDYDMLEGTYDLKALFDRGMSPREAVEAMAKEIFDLK
jgi:hypothetical protein